MRTPVLVSVLLLTAPAVAQEPAPPEPEAVGQIPPVHVFATFAAAFVPFRYQLYDFDGMLAEWTETSVSGFGIGPEVQVRLDLDAVLVYADGYYNPLADGVSFEARGGVVLGRLLGTRFITELVEFAGSEYTPTERVDTYVTHHGKTLPAFAGLMVGAGVTQTEEAVVEAIGIQPEHRRPGATLITVEAGFALIGAQFEIVAAPTFVVNHGQLGIRWRLQYGFPAGSIPIYYHISGAHHFGAIEDKALSFVLTTGIGFGTSLGVST